MISVAEALERVLSLGSPRETERVPLVEAAGRVLSETVHARLTQPPFSSSAMDGYAVIDSEAQPGMTLRVIGESAAGKRFGGRLNSGETVRIFTGAPVPEGADCVVIQEDVTRDGDTITISVNRDAGPYIRPAGGDFSKGDPFGAPRRLTPADVALLAAMNIAEVPVYRKPVVALVSNGNELVMPGDSPGPDQIISSNSFGLKALLEQQGADVRILPIARDTPESLMQVLDMAAGSDLIVTIGGASVGDHDLVHSVAVERGMDLGFYKVALQPGKPLMAGRLGDVPMVGLPGNPVSSMVCGHIFLRPLVDVMLGFPARALPRETGTLTKPMRGNGWREHYMRARVTIGADGPLVTPFERQDSALLSILGQANALLVRPPDDPAQEAGTKVSFIRLS